MRGRANMSGVTEQNGAPSQLPEKGEYLVRIDFVKDGQSSNGDPMISIKLKILTGIFADCWVWDNILIPDASSPAAKILGRTKKFLHCIGEPYEGDDIEWDSDRWLTRTCKIRIDHEPANKYHNYTKPVVAEYIFQDEPAETEQDPFA